MKQRFFKCQCGLSTPYELESIDAAAKAAGMFDHIDMLKHCPRCKREFQLEAILVNVNLVAALRRDT